MRESKTNPLIRLLPSLADFAFLMPVVFLFAGLHGARTLLSDGDTGWHVRTGEWILSHGRVPDRDLFSYTKPDQPWFAWEWLWDVIFGWLHLHWGMAAVVAGSLLVICVTSGLLFRLASRKCGNPLVAMAVTFLAMAGSSIHFLARPHLFTLLFTVIFCALLERTREDRRKGLLIWLPFLTILWTNLHGGWFVGILLIGLYAVGEFAGGALDGRAGTLRQGARNALPYAGTALLCATASLAGPYTYRLHVHIYQYLTDSFQREHILEMLPLSFQHPAARYFEIMLLVGGAAALWHIRRRRYTECLLVLFFAHLGLIASRNVPLFSIVATPVLALAITEWFGRLENAPVAKWLQHLARGLHAMADSIGTFEAVPRVRLASAAVLALVTALFYAPSPPAPFRAAFDAKSFPVKAAASLAPDASGRIFTYDQWGDFLIYKFYPKQRVFIDGRSDFYGSKFGERYLDILGVKYRWQQNLDQYGVDTVLMPADAPLSGALKESSRWRVVYDDGVAIVFRTESRPDGSTVSAAMNGGKDRDPKITSSGRRDRKITKTTT